MTADIESFGDEQQTHVVFRTSPKGEGSPFIGRCSLCGKEGLPADAALEPCPNPRGVSRDAALIGAFLGDDDENQG